MKSQITKGKGSCYAFETENSPFGSGLLDMFEITFEGLKKPIILYINGYDYETPKATKGFSIEHEYL